MDGRRKAVLFHARKGRKEPDMAEELQEVEAQEVEAEQAETDWKAKYESMREHMRDWEKKAKANQSAADELAGGEDVAEENPSRERAEH